jgi:hypothetical protein
VAAATAAAATASAAAAFFAATTTSAAASASAGASAPASATAGAGEHRVVDDKPDLSAQVLDVIDGRLFEEGRAIRVHEEFDSLFGYDSVIRLGLVFHGQHILKAARFGRYRDYSQRPISFTLFLHDFLELLDGEGCNFHCLFSLRDYLGKITSEFSAGSVLNKANTDRITQSTPSNTWSDHCDQRLSARLIDA